MKSTFGVLQFVRAEKETAEVPYALFELPKNHIIHSWKQVERIISVTNGYVPSTQDHVQHAIKTLEEIKELHDSTTCQFIIDQLQLLLTPPKGRRFTKHTLVFAVELWCISPAAYKMLQKSNTLTLPRDGMIRDLLDKTKGNENLTNLIQSLYPQQRNINILFDEVKLVSTLRSCVGHVLGMAKNHHEILPMTSNRQNASNLLSFFFDEYNGIFCLIPSILFRFFEK